jgi:hypothetical protein
MTIKLKEYMPYYYDINNNTVVVTEEDPTFATLNTLYIPESLAAGVYVVTVCFAWSMPDVNDSSLVVLKSTPQLTDEIVQQSEPKDLEDRVLRTVAHPIEYAGGPITWTLEASTTESSFDMTVYYSSIEFERKK